MVMDKDQNYWINLHYPQEDMNEIYITGYKGEEKIFDLHKMNYRRLNKQYINCFYPDYNMVMWIGCQSGIHRYDPTFASPGKPEFHTHIYQVTFSADSVYDYDFIRSETFSELHDDNRLAIPFNKNKTVKMLLNIEYLLIILCILTSFLFYFSLLKLF